jgi:lipid-A-disaccharide synthase
MRYYIIAGEASGDLHGGNLIHEIMNIDADAVIQGFGGEKMQAAGATITKHYREMAFMGFAEVVKNLGKIFKNFKDCKADIISFNPDVLICIDYPGFNIRMATWAKERGIKVVYYISPQVWAWKEKRVRIMKKCIDKMLVILPFEKDYYEKKWHWPVDYVGHPLAEVISKEKAIAPVSTLSNKPIVALLPGSRKQEILKKLPIMLEVSKHFPAYDFIVAKAPGTEESFYQQILAPYPQVKSVTGKTYDLLKQADAALVTSGTATLETALFEVPQVVCYKGSWLSYQIGKRLINVKYISLVNLIMDQEIVKELIQDELTVANLKVQLNDILNNEFKKQEIRNNYKVLIDVLSKGGNASKKAADIISKI